MKTVNDVYEYLDTCKIFYVTTVDGDKPKCRPFSFKMMHEDKIWFGVGTFKECYKQLQANPNIEICASDGKGFMRLYGTAVFDERPELFERACEEAAFLTKIYNDETGNVLGMFHIEGTAEFRSLFKVEDSVSL